MEKLIAFISAILLGLVMMALVAFPIMWLWNYLMPVLFGLPLINIWQAIAMGILSSIFSGNTVSKN